MNLYIKIENGQPVNHPITLENLQQIYPDFLDRTDELGYMICNHLSPPGPTEPFTKIIPNYSIQGNVVVTTYIVRSMTPEEKTEKINLKLNDPKPFPSWILNEEICEYVPPIDYPTDGLFYIWDEETISWIIPSSS